MAVNCSWKGSIRPPPGEVSNPHGLHESLKVVTLGQLELAAHLHRGNLSFVTYSGQSRSSHLSIFGHKFKHTEVTGGGKWEKLLWNLVSHIALMEDLKQSEKEMFLKMLTASFQSAWERLSMFETISALLELSVETSCCWTKWAKPVVTKWAVPAV